jgi:hypothetical protein
MKLVSEMVMVVMIVLMDMLTEILPPTPRRCGDDNGVDFLFTGGSGATGYALSKSRRGFSPPSSPQ